ncbi:MAG: chorismate mutase [Geminicoccaceae bacterium]
MVSPPEPELEVLRGEVDRIDRAVVELLAERLQVVRSIAALKNRDGAGGPAIRPGREAAILRRLVTQAGTRLPTATLVRMWRELLAATTRAQAPLAIAAYVPSDRTELWDLARDHFGSTAPIRRVHDSMDAIRLVAEGEADLVVLPLAEDGAGWWTGLAEQAPRVLARIPFVAGPGTGGALVLGAAGPDPSGDDLTLLLLETASGLAPDRLPAMLGSVGLMGRALAQARAHDGRQLHLVEIDGLLAPEGAALAKLCEPVLRCAWLGGYARPLAVDD